MLEPLKKIDSPYLRRWKTRILDLSLVSLVIALLVCAFFLMGCHQRPINPPIEERIFFQSEVKCEMVREECRFFVPGIGSFEEFMIVGQGAYERDQALLQECEEKALIKKRTP